MLDFCRYERFTKIMILTVLKNTQRPVKFWFIKNYLSPQFKVLFFSSVTLCSFLYPTNHECVCSSSKPHQVYPICPTQIKGLGRVREGAFNINLRKKVMKIRELLEMFRVFLNFFGEAKHANMAPL